MAELLPIDIAGIVVQLSDLHFVITGCASRDMCEDGGAIQHARGGIPTGALSIPCRYVHSACEVIDLRDLDSALAILKEFVNGEF